MIDRGIIKWQPFNSSFNSQNIIKEIAENKNRIILPILSDDQLKVLENKILDAYNLKLIIKIEYYFDGAIYQISGKINYLALNQKKILINKKEIWFKQILRITDI